MNEYQPEWDANEDQIEFAVFCVENLATDLNMDPTDVYDLLTVKSDVLSSYIVPCFDTLHTQDKQYVIDDIKRVLRIKGVLP